MGPSGGGKTTAASLIPRFWDVDEGIVKVGGVDVRQIDPHVLMDQVAFVFQNNRLFKASILENVRAARPDASREQVLDALEAAQCSDILEKLPQGLDTVIGTKGTYLSGGEAQRIALARAILKDAPIVVLDEATAFADPENEVLIQKAFARLTKGRTVIMIAHRLSTVVERIRSWCWTAAGWSSRAPTRNWLRQADCMPECGRITTRRSSGKWRAAAARRKNNVWSKVSAEVCPDRQGVENVKKGTFWTVIVNLVVMGGVSILYLVMSGLMTALTGGASLPSALPVLAGLGIFVLLSFLTHLQQYKATYGLVYREVKATRLRLAERLRKLPLGYFGKRDLADLTETLMGDVNRMEHVWSHVLGYLYGSYISTAVIAVCLLWYDWRLAIACLWGVPVAFVLLFGSRKSTERQAEQTKEAAVRVSDGMQEALENVREIRAANQEDRYLSGLYRKIDDHERVMIRGELVTGLFVNGASVIMRLGVATTILVGAQLILAGQIDFMLLFLFLMVITRIYAPFDQSLALIAELFVSQVSADRMNGLFDTPIAEGAETFCPKGHDIVFDHVDFAYDKEAVLQDVSFTARKGEITALVGPSGSGKSTCARLAARLWDVTGGSIRVGGVDIATVDPEMLLSDYSMVFQEVVLFDDTVMENIRLGKRGASDAEVIAAAKAANCQEFVSKLPQGYQTPIGGKRR